MNTKRRIQSLNQLRGISAIMVVMSHIENMRTVFGAACGSFAVCMFFLMSGFLAVLSTENGDNRFLIKRVVKLLPLYYSVTLFTFILALIKPEWFNTTNPTISNLVRSLLFIPYQNENGLIRPILDVGWYLNVQVIIYIIFWIAMKFSHKNRAVISSAVLLAFYGLGMIFLRENSFFSLYKDGLLMSAVGELSFFAYQKCKWKMNSKKNRLFSAILFCTTLFSGLLYSICKENAFGVLMIIIPIINYMFYLLLDSFIIEAKVLNFISTISLSLYLTHEFTVKGISRVILPLDELTFLKITVSISAVIVSIGVGYIVYLLIEDKITSYLLGKLYKCQNPIHQ